MPHREPFDPKRPLVAARDFTFAGEDFKPGEPFPKPGTPPDFFARRLIERQYSAHAVNHVALSADEQDADELIKITGPSGGRYTITAAWLDEPLVVRGKVPAFEKFDQIKADGPPLGWIAGGTETTVEEAGGGWYAIGAPWMDEPEKVQGREAAEARQLEIHSAGAPEPELEAVEGHAASVLISIDGDKRIVTAPWLDAPETFEGDTADADAEARQAVLRADGPPEGWEPPAEDPDANPDNAGTENDGQNDAPNGGGSDDAKTADGADAGAQGENEAEAGKSKDDPANA